MIRRAALPVVCLLLLVVSPAPGGERGAAALDQALRDLGSDLRAVCVAARPGEERLETLALLRRRHGVATLVVFLTGGGAEGPGRTATALVGAGARFLSLPDLGPCRSREEALERWGAEEAVRRLVAVLRAFRPHLILSGHREDGEPGCDQAAAVLLREAIAATAEPSRFPDAGEPWAVDRQYLVSPAAEASAVAETGLVDPVRGISYAEMGREARRAYQSAGQPNPAAPAPGRRRVPYRQVGWTGESPAGSLLSGLPVPRSEWLQEEARSGTRRKILERLLELREKGDGPPRRKMDAAVLATLGVDLVVTVPGGVLVEGETRAIRAAVVNGGHRPVDVQSVSVAAGTGTSPGRSPARDRRLLAGEALETEVSVATEPGAAHRRLTVIARIGLPPGLGFFTLERGIDLEVVPALSGEVTPWSRLFRPVDANGHLRVRIRNRSSGTVEGPVIVWIEGTDRVRASAPDRLSVAPGQEEILTVALEAGDRPEEGAYDILVRFGDLVVQDLLRVIAVEVPREMQVGVVPTRGDVEYQALRAMKLLPRVLDEVELETGDLSAYDTILLGPRPFKHRPVLRRVAPRLLRYVREGGHLVVGECAREDWSKEFAPYPLEMGEARVIGPQAPVEIPEREHRLLRFPNAVHRDLFAGWIGERGRHFPASWPRGRYRVLLSTAEPGWPPLPALLLAEHGSGTWALTSLNWQPQLESLNPAALKMLANLVSYPWRR